MSNSGRQRSRPQTKPKQKPGWFAEYRGTLVLLAVVALFGGYMLDLGGLKSELDRLFAGMNQSAHTHDAAVASNFIALLPFVIMGLGVALTWILFGGFGRKKKAKTARPEPTGTMTLHEFAEAAREHGVCAKVARAAYRILVLEHRERMRGILEANLREDLGMEAPAIQELYLDLLRRTDRPEGKAAEEATLLDLMRAVETRPDMAVVQARRPASTSKEARILVPLPLEQTPCAALKTPEPAQAATPVSASAATFVRPMRLGSEQWTVSDAAVTQSR